MMFAIFGGRHNCDHLEYGHFECDRFEYDDPEYGYSVNFSRSVRSTEQIISTEQRLPYKPFLSRPKIKKNSQDIGEIRLH